MIGRLAAAGAAVTPVAVSAVDAAGSAMMKSQPVVWHFLGYPFEAAPMIAGIGGCLVARFWIGAGQSLRREHRWALDLPVSTAVLLLTFVVILSRRPEPFMGVVCGLGAGVIGEGVFKIAEKYMRQILDALGVGGSADPKEP